MRGGPRPARAAPFRAGEANGQPDAFVVPIRITGDLAAAHPVAFNLTLVGALLVVGAALWASPRTSVIVAALSLCGVTWWLAQDFGVLGGTATDPNTALPLGLLLLAAAPWWPERADAPRPVRARAPRTGVDAGAAALVALGITVTVVAPLALAAALARSADASAVTADSSGGLRRIPPRAAPAFRFVDQRGEQVSTASLRGKIIVLTFLDPVCNTDCPLVAAQLALADRELGPLADRVEFVALNTNPVFNRVADVATFTRSHYLADLPNWHFVTGSVDAVDRTLVAYGITVVVPAAGMIEHSEAIYFITRGRASGRVPRRRCR